MLSGVKSTYPSRHAEMTANADRKLCCSIEKSWVFMKLLQSDKKDFLHSCVYSKEVWGLYVCLFSLD